MNTFASYLFAAAFWAAACLPAVAQFATVTYDRSLNVFGNYEALPSEQPLMFTGLAPAKTDVVEVYVFTYKGKKKRKPLAHASWHREEATVDSAPTTFKIPLSYPLEAGKKYDIYLHYLSLMEDDEKEMLEKTLMKTMDMYLRKVFDVQGRNLRLDGKVKEVYRHLNKIVYAGLERYTFPEAYGFSGFSELVKEHLASLEKISISKLSDFSSSTVPDSLKLGKRRKKSLEKTARHAQAREAALKALEEVLAAELHTALSGPVWKLTDVRFVNDYPTKARKGYFAVHVGYGTALIQQYPDHLDYGSSAYAGLSFPLATSTLAPVFMRNASLTAGVFFDNFSTQSGLEVSGPVLGRPFYLGLDYKLFQFVRFNAGATFMEMPSDPLNPSGDMRVFAQPFVGLSAKINLSLSFDQ